MGGETCRDLLRGNPFYGLDAETFMGDLQFLQRFLGYEAVSLGYYFATLQRNVAPSFPRFKESKVWAV
jgi:hypothetical protein